MSDRDTFAPFLAQVRSYDPARRGTVVDRVKDQPFRLIRYADNSDPQFEWLHINELQET